MAGERGRTKTSAFLLMLRFECALTIFFTVPRGYDFWLGAIVAGGLNRAEATFSSAAVVGLLTIFPFAVYKVIQVKLFTLGPFQVPLVSSRVMAGVE